MYSAGFASKKHDRGHNAVDKMTAKQKRFCEEYLVDLNATQAAIRAGYSKRAARSIGTENLTKQVIKAYISEKMNDKQKETIARQDEVLEYLTSVLRGESKSSVVVVENIEASRSKARELFKSPDERERLKAAELLGKRYSLFDSKSDENSGSLAKLDELIKGIDNAAKR